MRIAGSVFKILLAAALAIYCTRYFVLGPRDMLWDFKIYYTAAAAHARGLNPYDLKALRVVDPSAHHPFIYPPISLYALRPFTWFEFQTAREIYLALKLIALVALLRLWQACFMQRESGVFFLSFCLLAFNASAMRDLVSGNISVFEQLLLWSALYFHLVRPSSIRFCLLIGAAAMFKIFPIVFLGLLLWSEHPYRARLVGLSLCAFPLIVLGPMLWHSEWTQPLLASLIERNTEFGDINPTLLALVRGEFHEHYGRALTPAENAYVVLGVMLTFIALTGTALRRATSLQGHERDRVRLFLWTLGYALIIPRFKDYSFMLLLPASYYVLSRMTSRSGLILVVLGVELAGSRVCPMYVSELWTVGIWLRRIFCEYRALLLALAVWLLYLYWLNLPPHRLARPGDAAAALRTAASQTDSLPVRGSPV